MRRRYVLGSAVALSFVLTGAGSAVAKAAVKPAAAKADSKKHDAKKASTQAASKNAPATKSVAKSVPLPRSRPRLVLAERVLPAVPAGPVSADAALPVRPVSLTTAVAQITIPVPHPPSTPLAFAPTSSTSSADLSSVKDAIRAARAGKAEQATSIANGIGDPVARKLVEWVILRSDSNGATFARYAAFISVNASWPSMGMLRRRAEAMLWFEKLDPVITRGFFSGAKPLSARGKLALARALLAQGERGTAANYVRDAWRMDDFGFDLEEEIKDTFGDVVTRSDDKARMDRRLYVNDNNTALRAAQRLGGNEVAIVKARTAANEKAANAAALLAALPSAAQRDAGVIFSRLQLLRRAEKFDEAAELMVSAPHDAAQIHDVDEWWIERRLLARKLLDVGDNKLAYQIVRGAAAPTKENYVVDHEFMSGWIALRFLDDAATAAQHFARISPGLSNPHALARAGYWQGRAAEALGRTNEARAHYEAASRHTTTFYGQLARARSGYTDIPLATPPGSANERRTASERIELVRAADILYAVDERDIVVPLVADLGDKTTDVVALAALGEVSGKHNDARAMLLMGKAALGRGLAFDHYAFPTIGLPKYASIGPEVEPALVYSIARQESAFNPKTVSTANALGLMQVTPEAGRYIAKKFNVAYDQKRLLNDQVYNVQIGSAELGDALARYNGSYILTFAAYNAGSGRVRDWVARYGDPRDPKVDPVDWIERIPFAETRNYVQRIIENMQVYRVRFGGAPKLLIESDIRRGVAAN